MDTSLYPPRYQQKLLTLLSEKWDLDANTDGVLIHSDNFQALNLLQARYREQVKCIYIDPPYNTGTDGFIYKDNYQHSSWLTTMENRLQAAYPLLRQDGVNFISIDDSEQARLKQLGDLVYGEENFVADFIWQKKTGASDAKKIATITEYAFLYQRNDDFVANKNKQSFDLNRYRLSDEFIEERGNYYIDNLDRGGLQYSDSLNFGIVCPDGTITYPNGRLNKINEGWIWKWSEKKVEWALKNGFIEFRKSEKKDSGWSVCYKNYLFVDNEGKPGERAAPFKNLVTEVLNTDGNKEIRNLFVNKAFSFPKPSEFIKFFISISVGESALILDYFAGSGTTAHAVINLNREDGGNRKYILVEQGEYFDTVLKPRVQKVIYSENWKNGKPMPSEKQSDGFNGVSQIVKVLKLESYEDTLNNLELKGQADFIGGLPESVQEDYLLRYLLDVESKGSLLNSDDFTHPFDYCLNIATDSAGAYAKTNIDLVETFNYLLGLRVRHITDEREKRGYVMVEGALPNGDRCLIVWRDVEKMGYTEVAEFFNSQNITPNRDQYDVVYLNGDHYMANLWQNEDGTESRLSLRAIEPEFLRLMFA
ncbi:site-specific DNA-methyltransferase [Avibacterium avium]|uniref:site-specific DNA-methyltransferase n=1 Tax=Avibacterium avium TaxID=751 RepID=UPI003BF874CE